MLRIIIFAIIACVIGSVIKNNCSGFYLPFQIGVTVSALVYIITRVSGELSSFFSLIESIGAGYSVIKSLVKASLVTVGTRLGCDICRENGNNTMGDIIELGGKLMIFIIAAPYIISIIRISSSFLK